MTITSIVALMVPIIVAILAWLLALTSYKMREKSSSFECGFDPYSNARIPFSTRFFLLAIIFIIFDIEIVLLTPISLIYLFINPYTLTVSVTSFLLILLIGLIHEWNEGSLEWST